MSGGMGADSPGQSGGHSIQQSIQQSRRGEERVSVADTVLRQELRDALERVESKVDSLDEKVESKLDRLDEKVARAVEQRVSKDEYEATMAALEKRLERLEASPQRLLVWFGAGVAILSLVVSAFWVLLWVIEHAHP